MKHVKNRNAVATVFQASLAASLLTAAVAMAAEPPARLPAFRPPAVPLVTSDPYLSVWSMADRLTDDSTRHWTRRPHPLMSVIGIDGEFFRLMGAEPKNLPAMKQVGVRVLPTRSIYDFDDGRVHVTLTFMTPALPAELDVLARPLTYLTWDVRSVDQQAHAVSIMESTSGLLTVNSPDQQVEWARSTAGGLTVLRAGAAEPTLLQPTGDDTRINWGYLYVAAPSSTCKAAIGSSTSLIDHFVVRKTLPDQIDRGMPRAADDRPPALAFEFDLGLVQSNPVSRHLMIAYDELYAIKFLGQKLRPYWRRNGAGPDDLLRTAEHDYASLVGRCEAFDTELMADLTKAGGARYATLCALAYRQALAGCGLVADAHKQPLLFPKENSSNGCAATVDVIYPAAPQFLLMGPSYAKALVAPALIYSASPRWKFPFAPHDVGTYPQANGQVYGGGESSTNEADMMPVEESANMILLCAAIARMEGNADFSAPWWPQLTNWETYLEKFGEDPQNQLCTDDFMGHLAHNANLSVKAILAVAAYGELCRMRGDEAAAKKFKGVARDYARHWMTVAADGDHYRIAFDRPNTWSQKYNLVWDKLLGLEIFPAEVARKEVAFYKTNLQRFGLPLDSRTRLTKADWCLWTATLAEKPADFDAIVSPIYDYLNATTARLPFVDSYVTDDPRSDGMRARPVIGGVFIKMLEDASLWKKWASRDQAKVGGWAPAPVLPRVVETAPTPDRKPAQWRFTTTKPSGAWTELGYADRSWKQGPGGFGSPGTPGLALGTPWQTPDIWLRHVVKLPASADPARIQLRVYHDEDIEVYLNGVLATRQTGYVNAYELIDIPPAAVATLKPGAPLTIAVHCHQTWGGQGVDVSLVDVFENKP